MVLVVPSPEITMPVATVGHTGTPVSADGSIAAGNNHAGAIPAADIHAAIGGMRFAVAGDNRCYRRQ